MLLLVNQNDLSVDELATLAGTIMLSQASLHNLMVEGDADCHKDKVFAGNQRPSSSPKKLQEKKKTARVKQKTCWFHSRFSKDAKSCCLPCSWSGNGHRGAPRTRGLPQQL